ncbi:MAG: hypothetical protein JWR21_923 [Herminiimonas sp.]|nr:hypothetical protein [Herminiimonas sp.]
MTFNPTREWVAAGGLLQSPENNDDAPTPRVRAHGDDDYDRWAEFEDEPDATEHQRRP